MDDCSRLAFAEICADERQYTAAAFLKAALVYYAGLGIEVKAIMTDNGTSLNLKYEWWIWLIVRCRWTMKLEAENALMTTMAFPGVE